MKHPYFESTPDTTYQQEQRTFAKMKEQDQFRKRRKSRRRLLMWVLRRL